MTRYTDDQLLDALWAVSGHDEWVAAESVQRRVSPLWATGEDYISTVGVGRRLSRLAREGRCEVQHDYMGRYRLMRP